MRHSLCMTRCRCVCMHGCQAGVPLVWVREERRREGEQLVQEALEAQQAARDKVRRLKPAIWLCQGTD